MATKAQGRGHPAYVLVPLGLLALLYIASDGNHTPPCPVCAKDLCFDNSSRRPINETCCACPPSPERWEFHESQYEYYPPPVGLRTLRLSYDLQPGQLAVDRVYGTSDHPLRFPSAYHAFPHRSIYGAYNNVRLGNVGGVSPAFNGVNGDAAFGYPTYDSWLTLGDENQIYMNDIEWSGDMWSQLVAWTEATELLVYDGFIQYSSEFDVQTIGQQTPVLIAQVSYNATDRGPVGNATAWLSGPTSDGIRWTYAATWTWAF